MIAVMFFAVLVDRPAVSLHNLAIAALIVLVLEPEQAVSASFQMSFLAVMGLASFFEWWNRRVDNEQQVAGPLWVRWARKGILFVLASAITSLIAGSLSGIAAAHHFGRIAPYGVVANALALPIVSVAVMPMALLATVLMPFGLEKLPLLVMERGLNVVMTISDWVSTWPHAGLALPLLSPAVAVTLSFVAAFVCMSASSLRWLAVPAAGVAAWLAAGDSTPDIYIEERAKVVAAISADGHLVPSSVKGPRFAVSKWLAEVGQAETPAQAAKRALWLCDAKLCSAVVAGRKVVYLKETAELARPCPSADVVIAQYPLRRKCKGRLATIDRFDVWRKGAHTIIFTDDGVLIATVRETQGVRPWVFQPRPRARAP